MESINRMITVQQASMGIKQDSNSKIARAKRVGGGSKW
jgi:hypothetical protein